MLDGEGSGLEVCDLKGRAVSMEFAAALPDGAEVLVLITVGKLHAHCGRALCLTSQCS